MSSSLADIYRNKCTEIGVKCNSRFVTQLQQITNPSTLTEIDLFGNVVGPRGLLAVLDVVQACPALLRINLRGNNLSSPSIKDLCATLLEHPNVYSVNLSENDIRLAGPDLVDLIKRNTRIVELNLENTFLRPLFVNLVGIQLKRNLEERPGGLPAVATPAVPPPKPMNAKPAVGVAAASSTNKAAPKPVAVDAAAAGGKQQGPAAGKQASPKGGIKFADNAKKQDENPRELSPHPTQGAFAEGFSFGDEKSPSHAKGSTAPPTSPIYQAQDEPSEEGGFGNFAAFNDDPSAHHVRITDKVEVMSSASEINDGVIFKKTATRRPTVSAEVYTEDEVSNFKPQIIPKEETVRKTLMKYLEKNNLFSHLEDFELFVAVDQMQDSQRMPGDTIYDQGDEEGDTFYVVYEGEVSLSKDGKETARVTAGGSISEVMLLYSQTYDHSATCVSKCTIYSLMRPAYKFILTQSSKKKRAKYEGFLSGIGFLKGLTKPELLQLADALKSAQFEPGQHMITYGQTGEHFYIICEGVVDVIGRDVQTQQPKWVCDFTVGDCVGELEFLNNHKCVADVKAKTFVRVAMMNRHHFEMVMGPVKDVLARIANESNVYEYYRSQLAAMNEKH